MLKWLFAILGSVFYKIPGGIAGFFIGSLLDNLVGSKANKSGSSVFNDITRQSVSPADFEMQLISLCSIVIKADGKVSKTELDYVRQYFVQTYGKEKANAIFRTFNEVNKKHEISAKRICYYLNQRVRYEVRLQLVHFLFGIAQADGSVTAAEVEVIRDIAAYFKLGKRDYESVKAMFVASADTAYKILEIDKSATDDEVKKAYRAMAKKYHPDKVVTQNEAIKKGAEEKFKEVQKAYETIQKERGIN